MVGEDHKKFSKKFLFKEIFIYNIYGKPKCEKKCEKKLSKKAKRSGKGCWMN